MLDKEIQYITKNAEKWPKWTPKSEKYPNKPHHLPMHCEPTHISYALLAVLNDIYLRHTNTPEPFGNDPGASYMNF